MSSSPRLGTDLPTAPARNSSIERVQHHPSILNPPTRLQHSPSLPNIWFPPHRTPISPEIDSPARPSHRPSTPARPMLDSPDNSAAPPSALVHDRLSVDVSEVKNQVSATPASPSDAVVKSTSASYTKRFTRRQRPDRQRTNSLLTPPLTPSSSIKSTQSTASYSSDSGHGLSNVPPAQEPDQNLYNSEYECTHFIEVKNVSKHASTEFIRDIFVDALSDYPVQHSLPNSESGISNCGPRREEILKGVFIKSKEKHGVIIMAFYDVRWARVAIEAYMNPKTTILSQCLGDDINGDGVRAWFTCRFLGMDELVHITGTSPFVTPVDGGFNLLVLPKPTHGLKTSSEGAELSEVGAILSTFGDIWSFLPKENPEENEGKLFRVEYYDFRDAEAAYTALNEKDWSRFTFRAYGRRSHSISNAATLHETTVGHARGSQTRLKFISTTTSQASSTLIAKTEDGLATPMATSFPRYSIPDTPVSSSPTYFYTTSPHAPSPAIPTDARLDAANADDTMDQRMGDDAHHRQEPIQCYTRMQGCRYCPSRNSAAAEYPYYHTHPHPTPLPSIYFQQPLAEPFHTSTHGACGTYNDVPIQGMPLESIPSPWMFDNGVGPLPTMPVSSNHYWFAEGHSPFMASPYVARVTSPEGAAVPYYTTIPEMQATMQMDPTATPRGVYGSGVVSTSSTAPSMMTHLQSTGSSSGAIQERNQLNLARIEDGVDTRTTVMIKNIPNKMTDKDLITYINEVCPRKIDFLYLRMDFQNGCNVGYAFVNFIHVEDLLIFAKKRLGEKWNMFSSEKVLQMSYANYQGKEALVEKFKNSSIMDEREEWRPKIFYSSGPKIGLPEPFPPPTHLRRKERSSFNRGALYVPGVTQDSQAVRSRHGLHNNSPPRPPSRYLERQPARRHLDNRISSSNQGRGISRNTSD